MANVASEEEKKVAIARFREMAKEASFEAGFRQIVKEEAKGTAQFWSAIVAGGASIVVAFITHGTLTGSTTQHNAVIEAIKAGGDDHVKTKNLLELLCDRHFIATDREKHCPAPPTGTVTDSTGTGTDPVK